MKEVEYVQLLPMVIIPIRGLKCWHVIIVKIQVCNLMKHCSSVMLLIQETVITVLMKRMKLITVPLNYNFTFTRVSMRVTMHGSCGKCQKLPWKASFPRDGLWLFHAKTRGISRHVAFPRNESWNFHETSYRGISRGIFTRPVAVALKSQWLIKAFTIRNLFTIELF